MQRAVRLAFRRITRTVCTVQSLHAGHEGEGVQSSCAIPSDPLKPNPPVGSQESCQRLSKAPTSRIVRPQSRRK